MKDRLSISAEKLGVLLRTRYPAEEYALMYEVRDGTGHHACRSCDALVVNLWPSRGLEIQGFEFKVDRRDWLKELANPAKAEAIAAYCDRWWLVVSDESIVKPGELPPTWGLMSVKGGRLAVAREAGKLAPVALDRLFVAAIARAAQRFSPGKEVIAAAVNEALERLTKDYESRLASVRERNAEEYKALQRRVEEFEKASGVRIDRWDGKRIGEAVAIVLSRRTTVAPDIASAADQLERLVASLREVAKLPQIIEALRTEGLRPVVSGGTSSEDL